MTTTKTIDLLTSFVNQRSGIEYVNYGEITSFRKEQREILNDKKDFNELLNFALRRIENLDNKLENYLKTTNGRLNLVDNKKGDWALSYTTGQYFPTEYRPAANSVLSQLIWADYRDEKNGDNLVYTDGHEMRKALARNFSKRVTKNYFN